MGRTKKQEAKLDLEELDGGEMLPRRKPDAAAAGSSDDEEANEDLSLKIVEKALLKRAAMLAPVPFSGVVLDDDDDNDTDLSDGAGAGHKAVDLGEGEAIKDEKEKKRDKFIVNKVESQVQPTISLEDEEDATGAIDVVNSVDPNPVDSADNIVLRKLLRGPRYFDPPDNSWGACYNCGEEGHAAANCSQKRKRPCFICGSLEHNVKDCSKSNCFICKSNSHRAKDCPEKKKRGLQNEKICLKCGKSGHDMFHCGNDYSPEDLKEIQCYICKSFGHLCCLDSVDTDGSEISCYKCGLMGHTGLACGRARGGNQGETTASSCYKCGEEGHFARECTVSDKVSTSSLYGTQGEATPSLCYKCGQEGHFARDCTFSTKRRNILPERTQGDATPGSCYKCGQGGHFARECYYTDKSGQWSTGLRDGTKGEVASRSCYKCGQEGHFARECKFSSQQHKRNREPSTSVLRFYNEDMDYTGLNSLNNSKKSTKRKKNQETDGSATKPRKLKQRGGWVSENPGASKVKRPMKNSERVSPKTPSNGSGRFFNSQSPKKSHRFQYGDTSQPRFPTSRFNNSRNNSTSGKYDWW